MTASFAHSNGSARSNPILNDGFGALNALPSVTNFKSLLAIGAIIAQAGCSSSADNTASEHSGGNSASGGANAGAANGGATISTGGSGQSAGAPSGGASGGDDTASGGLLGSGGRPNGSASSGGVSSAGSAATAGMSALGGAAAAGGSSGSAAGQTGGGTGATCPLPTTFKWTSGGPIASPKSGWVAIKDFTHVFYNNQHIVYMTTHDDSNWGSAMMTFADWPDAAAATQNKTSFGVAPTLFYFTPKKLWVLSYQWGSHKFSYRTSTDPTNPSGWGSEKSLYSTALPSGGTGPIDQTVICNTTKCYLYYAGDNGHIYKSSLPIGNFPGEFPAGEDSGIQGTSQNLFEAVQVYSVKGANEYLMMVEAQGSARYFRAWTATDLDGPWTLLSDNFAIKSNVTFTTNWTNDISHGDLVRNNPDETFEIDPCNLQLLFQGADPNFKGDYGLIPYKLGLLTLVK